MQSEIFKNNKNAQKIIIKTTPWAIKNVALSISSPIIDPFSKFFHCHTVQTICNNVIIIHSTNVFLHYLVKYKCKQKLTTVTKNVPVNETTLQTNTAIYDLYDTGLC